jgi:hypothetical protein
MTTSPQPRSQAASHPASPVKLTPGRAGCSLVEAFLGGHMTFHGRGLPVGTEIVIAPRDCPIHDRCPPIDFLCDSCGRLLADRPISIARKEL